MDNSNQAATFSFGARRKQPQNVPMFNDPKQYVEKSNFHYNTGKEQKQVRRLTMRGSDSTIGIQWSQFGKNFNLGMLTVIQRLGIHENTIDNDNANRASYWIFESPEVANEVYERILMFDGKRVEFFKTVKYKESVTIINVPNFSGAGFAKDCAKEIMSELSKYGKVLDATGMFTPRLDPGMNQQRDMSVQQEARMMPQSEHTASNRVGTNPQQAKGKGLKLTTMTSSSFNSVNSVGSFNNTKQTSSNKTIISEELSFVEQISRKEYEKRKAKGQYYTSKTKIVYSNLPTEKQVAPQNTTLDHVTTAPAQPDSRFEFRNEEGAINADTFTGVRKPQTRHPKVIDSDLSSEGVQMDEDSESEMSCEKSGQVGIRTQDHTQGEFQDALSHGVESR
ncbi:hypothetical protein AX774_g2290 [Zancudomyces culisetae]|uniref:Uncharacterized protein n=1 Tax=Zancudomyces culisetae TaxID=1213189 RepID=A0A1R1PTE7_ZANCU|nr:hypothetical protein AX774_g2290 [Zancudomyces culisetae]|eukprot:OMH84199.1 hypothetical protein AX774_g2290 [Zancudomyces culisetae]